MPVRLVIVGCGGFGKELAAPALSVLDENNSNYDPNIGNVVFADSRTFSDKVCSLEVISLNSIRSNDRFILAIGDGATRQKLLADLSSKGARPYNLRSSTAVIGKEVDIGDGSVICDFSMITASASIGKQFQSNIYSYVAHDCVIGDFVTFAPRVCCNGNVHIGDNAYIGTGAIIRQGSSDKPIKIGSGAVVGMGAVVTKDVPPGATVIGNPARIMSKS